MHSQPAAHGRTHNRERAKSGTVTPAEQAMLAQEQAENLMAAADALVTPDLVEAVVQMLAPKAADVDADGFAVIDSKATFVAYDPKGRRPFKLHCAACSKPIMRADRAPGSSVSRPASGPRRFGPRSIPQADAAEAKNVAKVVKPAKPSKKSANPRTAREQDGDGPCEGDCRPVERFLLMKALILPARQRQGPRWSDADINLSWLQARVGGLD